MNMTFDYISQRKNNILVKIDKFTKPTTASN